MSIIDTKPVARKYGNSSNSTLVVLGGMRLYKGGVLKLNSDQVEEHKKELDRLVSEGYIVEVAMDTVPTYQVQPTFLDPLDQADEPDKDNLFVRQKSTDIFSFNSPVSTQDIDEDPDNIFAKPEDAKFVQTSEMAKPINPVLGAKTEQQILKEETIPASDINGEDHSRAVGDRAVSVMDGFAGTERTVTCVSGIADWRAAVKAVNEIRSMSELDKIIKYDPRPSVQNRAELRKTSLSGQR